ncbi:hypothetical protein TRIUR3_26797 [Triticum urartu]|uniref:Uncharacterized protein n=1 Tax=Triticum urartu TaxID=4572 RepID=M7ZE86_TRIUA|nr:hypothetical protein TRIUR3_26797 [Triticum urartu]
MTTMMHRTSQIDDAMEAMRAGRGRGGGAAGHEGHGGCGRKQHGLKERRMWAGSEVGKTRRLGNSKRRSFPFVLQVLRSVASLFFSLRRGEAANEGLILAHTVFGDWKSETDDRAYCFGYRWLEILWLDVPGAVRPFQDRFLWSCHTPITVEMGNGMGMGSKDVKMVWKTELAATCVLNFVFSLKHIVAVHPFDFWTHILMVLLQEVGDELVELIEIVENSPYGITKSENKEAGKLSASWYFSRKEIEENSPSKRDGIDLKKETYLRKSYCTYLQDLGMRLKVIYLVQRGMGMGSKDVKMVWKTELAATCVLK